MRIAHVAVWTADMQKSIEFYEKFGAKVGDKAEIHMPEGWIKSLCLMEFEGGVAVELTSPSDPSQMPGKVGRCEHFCLEVENVDAVVADLKAKGIDTFDRPEPSSLSIFGGVRIIFLEGPSGENIELMQHL